MTVMSMWINLNWGKRIPITSILSKLDKVIESVFIYPYWLQAKYTAVNEIISLYIKSGPIRYNSRQMSWKMSHGLITIWMGVLPSVTLNLDKLIWRGLYNNYWCISDGRSGVHFPCPRQRSGCSVRGRGPSPQQLQ